MKAPVLHAITVITRSLWVRFHMALILFWVLVVGVASSALLVRVGVRSMPVRYAIAVVLGYGVFLAGVRVWLGYARASLPHLEREVVEVDEGKRAASIPHGKASSDGNGVGNLAFAGDALGCAAEGCLVATIVTLIVAALGGALAYVLAATPELLGEAMVQVALATALRRRGRVWKGGHWTGSVLRSTWGVALVFLVVAVIAGLLTQAACPSAATLFEAMSRCRGK